MTPFLDPETRRVLLEEIAYQRTQRDGYRSVADDEAEPWGVQYKARLRAEGCNRAIVALRDVWSALQAVRRRHAENEMAVVDDGLYIGPIQHDPLMCAPGRCPGLRGCWYASCERGAHGVAVPG